MQKNVKKICQGILFVLIIIAFIYVGTRDFSSNTEIDNEKFDHDYPLVNKDNIFTYANANEIYATLKTGTAVIFMGFPTNAWTGYYAKMLNDVGKEVGVDKILYYDFYEDRKMKNATYQSIVVKLSNFLPVLDEKNQDIYAPTLLVVKNGKIMSFDNETAIKNGNTTPEEYWNSLKTGLKKNNLKMMLQDYLK